MESNLESQQIELNYERAGIGKIISSWLFDGLCTVVTFALLLFITLSIIQSNSSYKSILSSRNTTLIASHLYSGDEESTSKIITSIDSDETLTYNEKSEKLDTAMTYFFSSFINEELEGKGLDTYNSFKKEAENDGVKMFDSTYTRSLTNADYDDEYYAFYKDTYNNKAIGYLQLNSTYKDTRNKINIINLVSLCLTFIFSCCLFFLIVPLIFTRGKQTFGMKLTKLGVVGVNGLSCSNLRFILRFLFALVIECIGSVFAFLIPFGISITIMCLSKSHQTLHDYIANTYIVSIDESTIYKDVGEYQRALKKRETIIKVNPHVKY